MINDASRLFYQNEEQFIDSNINKMREFVTLFLDECGIDPLVFRKLLFMNGIDEKDYQEHFNFLKYLVIFDFSFMTYRKKFYELLFKSEYLLSQEIISFIRYFDKVSLGEFKYYGNVNPLIKNLSVTDKVRFDTDDYGSFSFVSTKMYLKDNIEAYDLITNNYTEGYCHQMSWRLMDLIDNSKIVTSLIPIYFGGTYYHSYINSEDTIIDAASGIVTSKEEYDRLYQPSEVISMTPSEAKNAYLESKELIGDTFVQPVTISLAKQLRG